jgi:CHAT domain-containing protein
MKRTTSTMSPPKAALVAGMVLMQALAAATIVESIAVDAQPTVVGRSRSPQGDAYLRQGSLAYSAGRMTEAIADAERARAIYSRDLGPYDLMTLTAMGNLANAYNGAGRTAEALALDEQIVAIERPRLRSDDPSMLLALNNLASDYTSVGRLNDAVKLNEYILGIRRRTLGPNHPDTLRTMGNLARDYMGVGRNPESMKLNEEVLAARRASLGPNHPFTADSMIALAGNYNTAGRYDEAVKLAEPAVAIRRSQLGMNHPDTIRGMSLLASSYEGEQRPADAIPLNEQVLAYRMSTYGSEDTQTLGTMSRLAIDYGNIGRYADSAKLYEAMLAASRRKFGDDNVATIAVMNGLVVNYLLLHRNAEALGLAQDALENSRKTLGEDTPQTLTSKSNLAMVYHAVGRDEDAVKINEPLLALQRQTLGADSMDTLRTMIGLGANYGAIGRIDDELKTEQEAYSIVRKKTGDDSPLTLETMNNLSVAYVQAGRSTDGLKLQEAVVAIRQQREGKESESTLTNMSNLAATYSALGRYQNAADLDEETLRLRIKTLGKDDPATIASMNNLAGDYFMLRRFDDAIGLSQQVYEKRRDTLGADNRDTLDSMTNLASAYEKTGRLQDAVRLREDALARLRRVQGPNSSRTIMTMIDLGRSFDLAGRPADALPLYEQGLQRLQRIAGNDNPLTLNAMYYLADSYYTAGRLSESEALRRKSLELIEKRAVTFKGLSRDERSTAMVNYISYYARFAQDLATDPSGYDEAFSVVERGKARSLLAELTAREAISSSGISPDDASRLATLRNSIEYLDGKLSAADTDEQRVALREQLDKNSAELDALNSRLMASHPRYAALSVIKPVTFDEARALIPAHGVFMSWLFNSSSSGVGLALPKDGALNVVKLTSGPQMVAHAQAYRWLLALPDARSFATAMQAQHLAAWQQDGALYIGASARPEDGVTITSNQYVAMRQQAIAVHGQWLSDTLLKPLTAQIDAASELIVSPDGVLATIPWDTLPWKGAPLGQQKQITIVQSMSVYGLLRARAVEYAKSRADGSARTQPLLVMGGAIYNSGSGLQNTSFQPPGEPALGVLEVPTSAAAEYQYRSAYDSMVSQVLPNLPGTRKEADLLHALMGGVEYTGLDASKVRLRALSDSGQLATFVNVHFAAHGYLDMAVPSLSAVVLTPTGKDEADNGFITAGEWPSFKLRSDLLVMSACETGLGKIVVGEGVQGLPYALYVAGNRDTLLSLWQVSDEATTTFMERFWEKVKGGQSHAQALTQTKQEFQDGKAGAEFRDPYFWAPFVLYGVQD